MLTLIINGINNNNAIKERRKTIFTSMDSTDYKDSDIQLFTGNSRVILEERDTVLHTAHGAISVGGRNISTTIQDKADYIRLSVPYGKRSTVSFSDGTIAFVNAGTTLVYPHRFGDTGAREVYLEGEVYLEVAHDNKRPFKVHVKKFDISVKGTKFNVNSFDNQIGASVVLVEGSVEITSGRHKDLLKPNQGYFIDNNSINIREIDVYPYICWKDGLMNLNGESLAVIFDRLSRYYNVEFECSPQIATETYAGKLNLTNSIEEVLQNLALSSPFNYSLKSAKKYLIY